jgi:dolichol kinase
VYSIQCFRDSLASSLFILASLYITAASAEPEAQAPVKSKPGVAKRIKEEKKEKKKIAGLLKMLVVQSALASLIIKVNGYCSILIGIVYSRCVKYLHFTFTLGERIVVLQGIALLARILLLEYDNSKQTQVVLLSWPSSFAATVVLAAVFLGVLFATILKLRAKTNDDLYTYTAALITLSLLVALCAYKPIVHDLLGNFIFRELQRMQIIAGWIVLLALTLPSMRLLSRTGRFPNIILRKGYHILAVALFLPALFSQPQLLGIALAGAFAVLAAVEVLRTGNIDGISTRIHSFMGSFVDERDAGVVFVTHFTLLLGMALPVWLSNAMEEEGNNSGSDSKSTVNTIWPAALAGILATGLGDAAASIVGSQIGRVPIAPKSKKTVEGTLAGAVIVMMAWFGLYQYRLIPEMQFVWGDNSRFINWAGLVAVTVLNSLLEASTEQLDNLFIPLHYFALLLCLFI